MKQQTAIIIAGGLIARAAAKHKKRREHREHPTANARQREARREVERRSILDRSPGQTKIGGTIRKIVLGIQWNVRQKWDTISF